MTKARKSKTRAGTSDAATPAAPAPLADAPTPGAAVEGLTVTADPHPGPPTDPHESGAPHPPTAAPATASPVEPAPAALTTTGTTPVSGKKPPAGTDPPVTAPQSTTAPAPPTEASGPAARSTGTAAGSAGATPLAGAAVDVLSSTPDGTTPAERAARAPADWESFRPAEPRPPTPLRRIGARTAERTAGLRGFLGHEWTLAALAALALAVALNWHALADPAHTLPQDHQDPALITYLIAWGGHALLHDPAHLWQLNAFFPAPYGLAYSDSLLGYAPSAFIGTGPDAAVLRYNIVYILAAALTLFGGYALARQLGIGRLGAAVAGVAWTMAPWRLAQAGHLHVLSAGGMALALAMLARGHDVRWFRTHDGAAEDRAPGARRRPGWALAGWVVAAWQLTIGFSLGLVFAYVLLGAFLVGGGVWLVRRRAIPPVRLLLVDGIGGLLFAGTAVLLAQPYLKVFALYPGQERSAAWIELYSPPLSGLLTAPAESWLWGGVHANAAAQLSVPGEMTLLPGFALIALAVAGLVFSVWSWRIRLALLAGVVVSVLLTLGTNGPGHGRFGYLLLLDNLPGFTGIRTPGRLIVWTTLLLALLAAGAICALVGRVREAAELRGLPRPPGLARAALLVPVVLILLEGLGTTPHVRVPPPPAALAHVPAPYLVLPSDSGNDQLAMLWSTDRFADLVNGGSGVEPTELTDTRQAVANFPDADSISYLRHLGVRSVVVIPGLSGDPRWQALADLPIDGLGITRDSDGDAIVFHLTP